MEALLATLKAAADPTRLRLLSLCSRSALSVSELTEILGQSQPRISRHLKLLTQAGLLERQKEGSRAYFQPALRSPTADIASQLLGYLPEDDQILRLDLERLQEVFQARADKAARYFRKSAAAWDQIRSLHVDEEEVESVLLGLVPSGARHLLDIGTGTGRLLELFHGKAKRLTGIDSSVEMLQVARANLDRARIRNCKLRRCNMYRLPLPSASFDVVTIHQVLHFAERPADVLAEAARVTAPLGHLLIVDFEKHDLEELREQHAHRWLGFSEREVANWLEESGLRLDSQTSLKGGSLDVGVWSAVRKRDLLPEAS